MEESRNSFFSVPGPWPGADAVVVARGRKGKAVRVQIRNLGGGTIALAFADQDVVSQPGPSANAYRLPAGQVDIFVLAPTQKMYATADANGVTASVATSDALPLFKE